jgi:hypothetical protein
VNILPIQSNDTNYIEVVNIVPPSAEIGRSIGIDLSASAKSKLDNFQTALDLKAPLDNPTFTGTVTGITKSMVGLGNVDNTTDLSKPISTATQTALDLKANLNNPTFTGIINCSNDKRFYCFANRRCEFGYPLSTKSLRSWLSFLAGTTGQVVSGVILEWNCYNLHCNENRHWSVSV